VYLHVRRHPGFFITNVCLIIAMVSSAGFIVYALDTDSLNDRVNTILTLLLTAVAFKLVIADSIPKVGYSTLIDNFVLYNIAFLFAQLIFCAIAYRLQHGKEDFEDADLMHTHLPQFFKLTKEVLDARKKLTSLSERLEEYDSTFPGDLKKAEWTKINNLRRSIESTKENMCVLKSKQWTVNKFIFLSALFIFISINLTWGWTVWNVSQDVGATALKEEKGRSWYALSFSDPSFLPMPGSSDERCDTDCPAGW
jgi:hypothetical protein